LLIGKKAQARAGRVADGFTDDREAASRGRTTGPAGMSDTDAGPGVAGAGTVGSPRSAGTAGVAEIISDTATAGDFISEAETSTLGGIFVGSEGFTDELPAQEPLSNPRKK